MAHIKKLGVQEHHKSIKSKTEFSKSPTKRIKTQTNHDVLSIVAFLQLENLKKRKNKNHFAMKPQIYLAAQKAARTELAVSSKTRRAACLDL
jgi:hypothetical protein